MVQTMRANIQNKVQPIGAYLPNYKLWYKQWEQTTKLQTMVQTMRANYQTTNYGTNNGSLNTNTVQPMGAKLSNCKL